MQKYLPWVLVAVVALLAGYYFFMMPPAGNTATVTLAALNNSGVSGTATLREESGNTVVTLSMAGGNPAVPMPAHIHEGSCPGVGTVAHALNSVSNGTSTTTLTGVTIASLKAQMPLAINVHESTENVGNYVACGTVNL